MEVQLAVLVQQLAELRADVHELAGKIDGPPWERSVRGRLHQLEGDSAAAKLASAQLAEAKLERRRAREERQRGVAALRVTRWKIIGTATATAVAAYPYIAHFSGWG